MDRRAFLATASAGLAVPLAGCLDGGLGDDSGSGTDDGAGGLLGGGLDESDFDVGMSANAFLPDRLEVAVGETVVWGNNGSRGHTVTAYDSGVPDGADFFASGGYESTAAARDAWTGGRGGNIAPGKTFEHTFETPGEHHYFCIPHERKGMTGVVVVTE